MEVYQARDFASGKTTTTERDEGEVRPMVFDILIGVCLIEYSFNVVDLFHAHLTQRANQTDDPTQHF